MKNYTIKKVNKDFIFLTDVMINKGTREKRLAYDVKKKEKAMFKYQKYQCTEACSEKLSYEIAKVLNYHCARIEFAKDEEGTLGVLNYMFADENNGQHTDAVAYLNNNGNRKDFYTIENIQKCLNRIDINLFNDFLKIMIFDALVGETDRHEENWGILYKDGKYEVSPLYDNGCNLLRELNNEKLMTYLNEENDSFERYINRSRTLIYNSENNRRYTHFELIKKLYLQNKEEMKKQLKILKLITDKKIEKIVNKIPNELMSDIHKQCVMKYLIIRREKLLKIIENENI